MFDFVKCVAEAIMEKGVGGLLGMVPGGPFAYDVAAAAHKKYKERRRDVELKAEIQKLAAASLEQAQQAAVEAAREFASTAPIEDRVNLELYLTQIPAAVQQSLKRPEDPTGKTVPSNFLLNTPEDVLRLLPARPPRFRLGDPLPGKPGWVLEKLLGVGGFGEVWLAKHPRMTSLVGAVKFCHGQHATDLQHEGALIDRVMQHGKHPNVVPLLDVNLEGETPWLMYEYVSGGDLADQIHAWQTLPKNDRVAKAMTALTQLAAAVGHFHQLNPPLVHRDMKPANILCDRTAGLFRITDFGIGAIAARAELQAEASGTTTRGGRLLSYLRGACTPLYASPQQRDGANPDPRDDVHALGVIGYQMITGDMSQDAGADFAEDLREHGADEELIALLGKCVAQKANRRPGDATELATAVRDITTGRTKLLESERQAEEHRQHRERQRIEAERRAQEERDQKARREEETRRAVVEQERRRAEEIKARERADVLRARLHTDFNSKRDRREYLDLRTPEMAKTDGAFSGRDALLLLPGIIASLAIACPIWLYTSLHSSEDLLTRALAGKLSAALGGFLLLVLTVAVSFEWDSITSKESARIINTIAGLAVGFVLSSVVTASLAANVWPNIVAVIVGIGVGPVIVSIFIFGIVYKEEDNNSNKALAVMSWEGVCRGGMILGGVGGTFLLGPIGAVVLTFIFVTVGILGLRRRNATLRAEFGPLPWREVGSRVYIREKYVPR